MDHTAQDPGGELERFREYVALLARLQLDPCLRNRIDLSGVVQQTLLEAFQAFDRFRTWNEAQKTAWLRKALAHNLTDELRKLHTGGRDVSRELSLRAALEQSSARLEALLGDHQDTPSQQMIRNEQLLGLAAALARLPQEQRTAVELHHLSGYAVAEIARQMGRTDGAVGALLVRGLRKLRELLRDAE